MGPEAFCECRGLVEVGLNWGLEAVRDFAFAYCALESLWLPRGVRVLGTGAFAYCTGMRRLTLKPGLREIGPCCFEGTGVREVEVPASVRVVGERAFYGCVGLRKLSFCGRSRLRAVGPRAFGRTGLRRESVSFPRRAEVDPEAFFE